LRDVNLLAFTTNPIAVGQAQEYGFVESFKRRLRDELVRHDGLLRLHSGSWSGNRLVPFSARAPA